MITLLYEVCIVKIIFSNGSIEREHCLCGLNSTCILCILKIYQNDKDELC